MQRILSYFKNNRDDLITIASVSIYIIFVLLSGKYTFLSFLIACFWLWVFYKRQTKINELKKRGLTLTDVSNIAFVQKWRDIRSAGQLRYLFVNGGLFTGICLFIPISFGLFYIVGLEQALKTLSDLVILAAVSLATAYLIGLIVYYARWHLNERRFLNLNTFTNIVNG